MFKSVLLVVLFATIIIANPIKKDDEEIKPMAPVDAPTTTAASVSNVEETTQRRVIMYDQRQEGKYNIRADLENFIILLVPSKSSSNNPLTGGGGGGGGASSGLSFFDLLTRSQQRRRTQGKNNNNKEKNLTKKLQQQKQQQQLNINNSKLDYLPKKDSPLSSELIINTKEQHNNEFIEGRTPYRVDITSLDTNTDSVHHLEIMQPPILKTIQSKGNDDDDVVEDLVMVNNNNNNNNNIKNNINNRQIKSLFNLSNDNYNNFNDLTDTSKLFDSLNTDNVNVDRLINFNDNDNLQQRQQQQQQDVNNDDDWELKLIGAEEQCGPDRKRDSYGVCQFISLD